MANHPSVCIDCDQSNQTLPLLRFQCQGRHYGIFPQYLTILIDKPIRLADELPGLKLAGPSESHS